MITWISISQKKELRRGQDNMKIKYFDLESFKKQGIEWIKALREDIKKYGKQTIQLNEETNKILGIGWNLGKQSFIMEFLEIKENEIN